jgi:hypothetical protein
MVALDAVDLARIQDRLPLTGAALAEERAVGGKPAFAESAPAFLSL